LSEIEKEINKKLQSFRESFQKDGMVNSIIFLDDNEMYIKEVSWYMITRSLDILKGSFNSALAVEVRFKKPEK
jgi:hypothetical protein